MADAVRDMWDTVISVLATLLLYKLKRVESCPVGVCKIEL